MKQSLEVVIQNNLMGSYLNNICINLSINIWSVFFTWSKFTSTMFSSCNNITINSIECQLKNVVIGKLYAPLSTLLNIFDIFVVIMSYHRPPSWHSDHFSKGIASNQLSASGLILQIVSICMLKFSTLVFKAALHKSYFKHLSLKRVKVAK